VIEGDIKGFFDNVDHQILADILARKVEDKRFLDLYWKLVHAGYVESGRFVESQIGVPQGGLLSPLLSNIYLHEFDEYMEGKIEELSTKGKSISKVNPKIAWYTTRLTRLSERFRETRDPGILKQIKALRRERNSIPSRIRINNRIYYVRYADDWIIGIIGTFEFAELLKEEITTFLRENLKLTLSQEKTKITHLNAERAKFLGVEFHIPSPKESKVVTRNMADGRKIVSRVNHARIYFQAPIEEIYKELFKAGFTKDEKRGIPNAITKWIYLDHRSILLRYNEVARGYLNYYSFVDNYQAIVGMIKHTLLHSCAKTLARKFKLGSRASAFSKFGKDLSPKDEITTMEEIASRRRKPRNIGFHLPDSGCKTRKFSITTERKDPMDVLKWRVSTQIALFDSACYVCGAEGDIQMHHVKHLRKGGEKTTGFTKVMSMLNRKQFPVCPACHNNIHAGKYDGISLKELHIRQGQRGR